MSSSLAVRLLHAFLLLLVIGWILPWGLIPWSLTPREELLGQIRLGFAIFSCHIALVVWPCAYFLFRYLFRQTRWIERAKLAGLLALCLWCAWGATAVVAATVDEGVARLVSLPSAAPFIATGVRVAASSGFVVAVAVELIGTGMGGIGAFAAQTESGTGDMSVMIAIAVWSGLIGLAVNAVFVGAERRLFGWHFALTAATGEQR